MGTHIRELFDLTGWVAIITGGNRNLGYDTAEALAEAGASVVITSRDDQRASKAAQGLARRTGTRAVGVQLEVTDEAGWAAVVDRVANDLGRIDILVNNAGGRGVVYGQPEPDLDMAAYFLEDRSLADWRSVLDVNLTGVFLGCRAVAPVMKAQRAGKIVNIASADGIMGRDLRVYEDTGLNPTVPDYLAAKGGVINLTRGVAVVLAPYGINVNSISPGGFFRN
ncbi:MAG TPA: SDR family NAD(P)-dependent oxidoreductase, partial [Anaerolineae bacterium]|nr:SDR family NAD(P)-dependent oxidoreductase [Anaerolineae bacterium]